MLRDYFCSPEASPPAVCHETTIACMHTCMHVAGKQTPLHRVATELKLGDIQYILSHCPTCGRPVVGTSGCFAAAVTMRSAKTFLAVIF